ncbi:protein YbhK [Salmonella enterica subsp. arizonae]|uniref:Protein YbhK n=1 Tax=Salmonella enterica subsp. arizonae TaxID=59203 RepID=A0A379S5X5_SALER|nr:protein YbhK [Salmonella enterica subsp. arizonae]
MRPLEAINLIRNLLKVDAQLIPMSELPVDLMAIDEHGHEIYGEVNIDQLATRRAGAHVNAKGAGDAGSGTGH